MKWVLSEGEDAERREHAEWIVAGKTRGCRPFGGWELALKRAESRQIGERERQPSLCHDW